MLVKGNGCKYYVKFGFAPESKLIRWAGYFCKGTCDPASRKFFKLSEEEMLLWLTDSLS